MTEQEMRIMEEHTRALHLHTQAMQEIIPLLYLLTGEKHMNALEGSANRMMMAAEKIDNALFTLTRNAEMMHDASGKNVEAANKMYAASLNRNGY